MASKTEIARLAAALNRLRSDWPASSVLTYLQREHAARPWRDLAVAATWVACDLSSITPARLGENGPWWAATRPLAEVHVLPTYRGEPPRELDPDDPAAYLAWYRERTSS